MTLSPQAVKALTILASMKEPREGMTPHQFARHYFAPDNLGWSRVSNVGHGATHGVGMWRSAGGFLGKLRHRGLVEHNFITGWDSRKNREVIFHACYRITAKGREALKEASDISSRNRVGDGNKSD